MRINWNAEEITIAEIIKKLSGKYANKLLENERFCNSFSQIFVGTGFSSRANILDIIMLDEKEIYDEDFFRLWQFYSKDVAEYETVLSFLRLFSKEEILKNLSLEYPVPFIEYPLIFKGVEVQNGRLYEIKNFEERDLYRFAIRQKFIREYNKELEKEGGDQNLRILEEKYEFEKASSVDDNYMVSLRKLYFGTSQVAVISAGLDFQFQELCWLENKSCFLKIDGKDYGVFQNLLYNESLLLDESGKIYLPGEELKISGYSISPNSQTRSVTASSLIQISIDAKENLEKDFTTGEVQEDEYFERKESIELLDELLETKRQLPYRELSQLLPLVRRLFEETYGPLFPPEKGDVQPSNGL